MWSRLGQRRALASRLLVTDEEWIESARRRMIAGEEPHIERFLLSHRSGRPKDVDQPAAKPPIVFGPAFSDPGIRSVVRRLVVVVIGVALVTGCTFPVTLRHPETGATVRCGPYYYTRTPAVATAAGAKEARCVEEYERQGYVRLRR